MTHHLVRPPYRFLSLLAILSCLAAGTGHAQTGEDLDMATTGLLPVTAYGAVPDDGKDDTRALQRAIDDARDRGLVTFFPSGVYHVSDTLSAVQPTTWNKKRRRWIHHRDKPNILLGTTRGGRAVLRLTDNAEGFDNAANPKALIWIWAQPRNDKSSGGKRNLASLDPNDEQPNISFDQVFRGIDVDLRAAGNRGAIGIRHAGSQGSMLEDVTIWAEGAFAGIVNPPGQGGGAYDITVHGGRFGIVGERRARFPVLAGIRLLDQEKANLVWEGQSNISIAGFHFRKAKSGDAVVLRRHKKPYNSAMVLVDGAIEIPGGTALDDADGGNLYLQRVWLKGADAINAAGAGKLEAPVKDWLLVKRFAHGKASGGAAYVDGRTGVGDAELMKDSVGAPDIDALIAAHQAARPSFEDPETVDVTRFGAIPNDNKDDSRAIAEALAKSKQVFLPKGVYLLSETLTIPKDRTLFGVAKHLSVLRAQSNWRGAPGTPLIATADDAAATTRLSTLRLELGNDQAQTAIAWRAGRNSIVRDVLVGLPRSKKGRKGAKGTSERRDMFRIEGNGGGRWYGLAAEWNVVRFATGGPDYRHLRVTGTKEPLVFYGINIERSLTEPQALIEQARDVKIFYLKSEPQEKRGNLILEIKGSEDISVYGYSGISNRKGGAIFRVTDSTGITVANIQPLRPFENLIMIEENYGGASPKVLSGSAAMVMYRRSGKPGQQK